MLCGRCHRAVHPNHCSGTIISCAHVCVCVCVCVTQNMERPGLVHPDQWGQVWELHPRSVGYVRPAGGERPRHSSESSGRFIPDTVSNKKAVSFRKQDRKKGGGGGWFKVKYTQIHRGKEKSAGGSHQDTMQKLDLRPPEWGQGGPQVYQDLFLIIKRKPGGLSNKFYSSVLWGESEVLHCGAGSWGSVAELCC